MIIFGIDPGTSKFGVAWMQYDSVTGVVGRIEAATIDPYHEYAADLYSQHLRTELNAHLRTELITRVLSRYLVSVQPDMCVIETPFINMRMPKSFIILSSHFEAISNCVDSYRIPIFPQSPQSIKKEMKAAGKKGKQIMMDNLIANHELTSQMIQNPTDLSEHAIDAIAACYCFVKKSRRGEL